MINSQTFKSKRRQDDNGITRPCIMKVLNMGTRFGSEIVIMKKGDNIMDVLMIVLEKKDILKNSEYGLLINNMVITDINECEVTCEVEYQY